MKHQTELAPVCLRIRAQHLEYLRQLAREQAATQQKNVSLSDLVKLAVEQVYPIPDEHA